MSNAFDDPRVRFIAQLAATLAAPHRATAPEDRALIASECITMALTLIEEAALACGLRDQSRPDDEAP